MTQPLTDRQEEIHQYMIDYLLEHHNQPTRIQIANQFEISKKSVQAHVDCLINKGWIENISTTQHAEYRFIGVKLSAVQIAEENK